jgi:hypothetical protein
MNQHPLQGTNKTCLYIESVDINFVNMHEKPWDIILQLKEEINLV